VKWEWAVEVHHFAYNSAPADKWDRIIVAATVRTMNNHDFLVGVHSHIGHTALLPADVHQNHAIYVDENTMTPVEQLVKDIAKQMVMVYLGFLVRSQP